MSSAVGMHRVLVVGAGAIGGVVAAHLLDAGVDVVTLTTNGAIADALRAQGFQLTGERGPKTVRAGEVWSELTEGEPFDCVFLATQPPQVEDAARAVAPHLSASGRVVCFQNGLCEERVAKFVGRERVVGAVVAWGASMIAPGKYDRTSAGGFTVGTLGGEPDDAARAVAALLEHVGPVVITKNLIGARYSKLAINCAISTLGTIGGDRLGALMRFGFVRRLALDIMTEAVVVARAEGIVLEKVAGTIDLDWLALTDAERVARRSPTLVAKHAVLLGAGFRYRRLRSSMLSAIERGRPPAIDFLNGEIVDRAAKHGISVPVNRAAQELVWGIARGDANVGVPALERLYERTR